MEISIFKKNEIYFDLFKNQEIYTFKNILKNEIYGNFKDLDKTKERLDSLDKNAERSRRAAAKYLNEYELVKIICKKQVISRAYFKLYEIIYFEPVVTAESCDCFFICDAPGGFIECINDIRRKKNLRTKYISISNGVDGIYYGNYLEEFNLLYGDITEINVLNKTIETVLTRFPNGLNLITADGGFDVKVFKFQEIITSKLLLCEIYLALATQKTGGTFVIKFFDMFTHNSIIYYIILCSFYNYVKIIKPKTSRNCNSERYVVCYNFKGKDDHFINDIYKIIMDFKENIVVYPNFDFNPFPHFAKKLSIFNNLVLYEQIKTINESIKMVNTKDTYFQNLILKIFIKNKNPEVNKLYNILIYKNILASRIKKCIDFLRMYNININQLRLN